MRAGRAGPDPYRPVWFLIAFTFTLPTARRAHTRQGHSISHKSRSVHKDIMDSHTPFNSLTLTRALRWARGADRARCRCDPSVQCYQRLAKAPPHQCYKSGHYARILSPGAHTLKEVGTGWYPMGTQWNYPLINDWVLTGRAHLSVPAGTCLPRHAPAL